MTVRFRLSDVDRERLGVTHEWLEYDPHRLMAREASMLHRSTGYDPVRLGTALQGRPKVDPDTGEPVFEDEAVLDDDGNPVLDEETGEAKTQRVRATDPDYGAWLAVVWLALIRAGYAVPFKGFDFDLIGMQVESDKAAPAGEALAPGTPGGSD